MTGSFRRNVLTTYGTQLAALPLNFAGAVLQARLLGPAGRGQVSLLATDSALAVLCLGFGLGSAITFHIAADKVEPRALVRPLLAVFGSVVALLAIVAVLVTQLGFGRALLPDGVSPLVAVLALVLLFAPTLLNAWLIAALAARRDFAFLNGVTVVAVVLPATAYATLLGTHWTGARVGPVFAILVANEFIRTIVLAARFAKTMPRPAADVSRAIPIGQMARYSLLAYACDVVQFFTYRLDMWLVKYYRGAVELGLYSLAVTLAELAWLLPASLAYVLFPSVPSLERRDAVRLAIRASYFALASSAALGVVGYVLAVPLLPVLFSRRFAPSVPLLGLLLLGIVPASVAKVLGNLLAGVGLLRVNLIIASAVLALCIVVDLLLIPRFGARGAAIATSITYATYAAATVVAVHRVAARPASR